MVTERDAAFLESLGMSEDSHQFESIDAYIAYMEQDFLRYHRQRDIAMLSFREMVCSNYYIAGARSVLNDRIGNKLNPYIDFGLVFDYHTAFTSLPMIAKEANLSQQYDSIPSKDILEGDAPWEHVDIAMKTDAVRQAFRLVNKYGVPGDWVLELPESSLVFFGYGLRHLHSAGIPAAALRPDDFPTYAIHVDDDRISRLYRGGVPASILGICYESELPEDDIIHAATTLPPEYAVAVVS